MRTRCYTTCGDVTADGPHRCVCGSIGTVAVQKWLRARRKRLERRDALVRRYLFQLQDAVETLWHRVDNVRHQGGKGAMTPDDQASTTVYALDRVLEGGPVGGQVAQEADHALDDRGLERVGGQLEGSGRPPTRRTVP